MRAATAALGLCLPLLACKGAAAPGPDPRALAHATVITLEQAWIVAAKTCIAEAAQEASPAITLTKCRDILDPSRQALIAADDAVAAWGAADQTNFPCLISDSLGGLKAIQNLLSMAGVVLPSVVSDALTLGANFAPQCAIDAGPTPGEYGAAAYEILFMGRL